MKEDKINLMQQELRIFPPFYDLDNLAKEFIEKNNLPKDYSAKDTRHGKLVLWTDDSYFILSQKGNGIENLLQPYIGGNPNHLYKSNKINYFLDGELNGKKVSLEASINETQDYEQKENPVRCFAPTYEPNGEPAVCKKRNDKENYWFVVDAEK